MDADIVVVGGGPVGLHAALKAAVLNHSVLVLDKGARFSRVSQAPAIANIPLRPGISGPELLRQSREDLARFQDLSGKRLVELWDGAEAVSARRAEGAFRVRVRRADGGEREVAAPVLVLATGVVDRKPGIDHYHETGQNTMAPYLHRGGHGYCLLCEGWALEGRRVAVVGSSGDSVQIAVDLARHFRADVVLATDGLDLESPQDPERLRGARVALESAPIERVEGDEGHVRVRLRDGRVLRADKAMFTMGWYKANNELAVMLGAATTREGFVVTDDNSEALDAEGRRIEGLFAVGDLRAGRWKQVVVGWGDAESAIITAYAKRLPD